MPSAGAVRDALGTRTSRASLAVVAITVIALVLRLFALGSRVAHQDEARVAYWAYSYMETGVYWYRPIVHGPFLAIVDSYVFQLFGATDFTMRLVVALLGGLLPLSALLFRGRLRDSETVALALLLALNPILLYFSRFYRNDVLLAGFMLAAFGCFVRAYDTQNPKYLYAGTAIFALAFTTKENALVYPVCWAGAAFLLWDRRTLVERADDGGVLGVAAERGKRIARGVWNWAPQFALAVAEFLAIVVFFYAPRGERANPGPTLGETLADPTLLPALVDEALVGSWHAFTGQWGAGNSKSYIHAVKGLWPVLERGAIVLLALAVAGFLYDRYRGERPRDVVAFATFWGVFSLLGYPVIVDNPFPWETVHMVVPLAVPAAVGLALVARLGLASLADGDALSATAAALVLLVVVGQVGATAVATSYQHPQKPSNEFVQYAQSSSEMKPMLREVSEAVRSNPETRIDVLFYGSEFYVADEASDDVMPGTGGWFERLPFAWYLERYGAELDSTHSRGVVAEETPPVVVALGNSSTCDRHYDDADDVEQYLDGYERHEVQRFAGESGCKKSPVVMFVARATNESSDTTTA